MERTKPPIISTNKKKKKRHVRINWIELQWKTNYTGGYPNNDKTIRNSVISDDIISGGPKVTPNKGLLARVGIGSVGG
jgi:hypothetical protein